MLSVSLSVLLAVLRSVSVSLYDPAVVFLGAFTVGTVVAADTHRSRDADTNRVRRRDSARDNDRETGTDSL